MLISALRTRAGLLHPAQAALLWPAARWLHGGGDAWSHGDLIHMRGLTFHGYHGVYPEENRLGQKFVVDATLLTDLRQAGQTDDLRHTVNYAQVYEEIKSVVEGRPQQLIEAVAERVAERILEAHPLVRAVRVGVHKPHVAVSGVVESLGIEISREREPPARPCGPVTSTIDGGVHGGQLVSIPAGAICCNR